MKVRAVDVYGLYMIARGGADLIGSDDREEAKEFLEMRLQIKR